jgi:alpha-D-ribose 1-methylphosphonate 5-triphosphate synthase subunit PhnH
MIAPGFGNVAEAGQRHFRALLDAMARPGRMVVLDGELPEPPQGLTAGVWALALALLDYETPVWSDQKGALASLRFHCGCRVVETARAAFALVADPRAMPPLAAFHQGEPDYPDRSTTLILQVEGLDDTGVALSGPGIRGAARLGVGGVAPDFWVQVAANHRRFPLGVDLVLVAGARLAALPRSTRVEV